MHSPTLQPTPTVDARIKVLVVDDHPLFRRGIVQLVNEQAPYQVIDDLDSGQNLQAALEQHQPELVLLDLNLPDISGLTLLQQVKQFNPDTTVVMITASEQDSDLFQALSLGANGYLMKDTAPDEMLARIRQALDGQVALNEHSVTLLAQSLQHQPLQSSTSHSSTSPHSPQTASQSTLQQPIQPPSLPADGAVASPTSLEGVSNTRSTTDSQIDFTTRERQTLTLISQGLNNKLIARELGISDGTVKVYVKSLLRKLNLHSRLELAAWVHKNPNAIRNPF
ncbi:MAG: DNA-binding response regulator [Oceanospirillaceae bacterium]|nr:DNA-binding response regulator [Oceanospirillaceae bacterium]|tara:strand:+ start:856 stop:1698 length:843 start_codon:yes stop_codon:yes gene_type:complete